MQKLSEEKLEKLITIVRLKPVLYERSLFPRKYERRERAWKEIAAELKEDVKYCKTAWRSLRDAFLKNFKEIKGTTEQEHIKLCKKKHKYFAKLLFLRDSYERCVLSPKSYDIEESNSLEGSNFNEDTSLKEDQTEKSQSSFLDDTDPLTHPEQSIYKIKPSSISSYEDDSFSPYSPPPSLIKISSVSSSHKTKTPEKQKQNTQESFSDSKCQEYFKSITCHCANYKQPSFDPLDGFFLSISSTAKNYNLSVSDLALFQCKIMTFAYQELQKLKK